MMFVHCLWVYKGRTESSHVNELVYRLGRGAAGELVQPSQGLKSFPRLRSDFLISSV